MESKIRVLMVHLQTEVVQTIMKKEMKKSMTCLSHLQWAVKWLILDPDLLQDMLRDVDDPAMNQRDSMKFRNYYVVLVNPRSKTTRNDIDVFLEPVIDDREILWKEGVETWDAYGRENFTLRVPLFCTINDYPALGNLSGQTVKGRRHALTEMSIRSELQPVTDEKTGRVYLPPACHTLSNDEKIAMLSCLADIKVPSGYCARITFMREMWLFKRYMGILKSYVRNRAKPEGSIVEGYTTEEAIEFCIDYMADTNPIGVPTSRHEGRLAGVNTTGRKRIIPYQASYAQAHFAVLQHMAEVTPYFEEHLAKVRRDNIGRSDIWINREHGARFNEWLKDRVARSTDGPSEILQSWVNIRNGVKVDKEGFTLMDLAKVGYADEPFILAKQVEQILYIKDPANKKMHVVRDGKQRIVGVDNVVDEE
uniref:OSJNBb0068N06.20 protein n=1 Tax=Oryza sativa subsp. japonica TaxID=39947 RepID=Q7F9R0_ORYSJ|nr:OSJNBb0068N06.20 [Oryza sativa Japonica Group]